MLSQASFVDKYRPVGPSSGSSAVLSQVKLSENERLIAIENVGMMGGPVFIRSAPSETIVHARSIEAVRPAISESIERSLNEHADVWAELAKF